jgi:hypothetical protein
MLCLVLSVVYLVPSRVVYYIAYILNQGPTILVQTLEIMGLSSAISHKGVLAYISCIFIAPFCFFLNILTCVKTLAYSRLAFEPILT